MLNFIHTHTHTHAHTQVETEQMDTNIEKALYTLMKRAIYEKNEKLEK